MHLLHCANFNFAVFERRLDGKVRIFCPPRPPPPPPPPSVCYTLTCSHGIMGPNTAQNATIWHKLHLHVEQTAQPANRPPESQSWRMSVHFNFGATLAPKWLEASSRARHAQKDMTRIEISYAKTSTGHANVECLPTLSRHAPTTMLVVTALIPTAGSAGLGQALHMCSPACHNARHGMWNWALCTSATATVGLQGPRAIKGSRPLLRKCVVHYITSPFMSLLVPVA